MSFVIITELVDFVVYSSGAVQCDRSVRRKLPAFLSAACPPSLQSGAPNFATCSGHAVSSEEIVRCQAQCPLRRKLPATLTSAPVAALPKLRDLTLSQCRVVYVWLAFEVEHWCARLQRLRVSALGMDIEWRVTFRAGEVPRRTALIQLCYREPGGGGEPSALPVRKEATPGPVTGRGHEQLPTSCLKLGIGSPSPPYTCLLLHVAHTGISPALAAILGDAEVRKAGVGISGDAQKLARDHGLCCRGLVDLGTCANMRLAPAQRQKWSLAGLVERILMRRLAKLPALRLSNWEVRPLSAEQQQYAALDALASLLLAEELQGMPVLEQPLDESHASSGTAHPAGADTAHPIDCALCAVAALPKLGRLQPAKAAVWELFTKEGLSIPALALQRGVRESTVQSYLADGIAAGYQYTWQHFGITDSFLMSVARAAAAHVGAAGARHDAAQSEGVAGVPAGGGAGPREAGDVMRGAEAVEHGWLGGARGRIMRPPGDMIEERGAGLGGGDASGDVGPVGRCGAAEVPLVPGTAVLAGAGGEGVACIMICDGSMGGCAESQSDLGVFPQEKCSTGDDDAYVQAQYAMGTARPSTQVGGTRHTHSLQLQESPESTPEPSVPEGTAAEPSICRSRPEGAKGMAEGVGIQAEVPPAFEDIPTSLWLAPTGMDVAALIDERGALKALRERLLLERGDVEFGQLRLALVHLARLQFQVQAS